MTAEERGMELALVPMSKLPPLALGYMRELARRVGMCGEVCIDAYTVYAHLEEGLPVDGDKAAFIAGERAAFEATKTRYEAWLKQQPTSPATSTSSASPTSPSIGESTSAASGTSEPSGRMGSTSSDPSTPGSLPR